MLGAREEREIRLNEEIKKYELVVRVIDFLVNEEVVSDTIPLRSKIFSAKTLLLTSQKDLRLEFACNVPGQYQSLEME